MPQRSIPFVVGRLPEQFVVNRWATGHARFEPLRGFSHDHAASFDIYPYCTRYDAEHTTQMLSFIKDIPNF